MTIDQLTAKRRNGLQALIDNGWLVGFKRLLTDLYPDNAHFIYELLQNAEDAKASEVRFTLNTDGVEFEHNGSELFTIEDVESITNFGSSAKADDPTNIGKFGVGFKAVFAYTATPEIESGLFHFRIREMVVPESLSPGSLGERKTRFVFPFDNPEKPPEKAQAEIEKHLRELNENTLLFLSNIRKIEYRLPDATEGFLERRETADDEHQIEIAVMRQGRTVPESVHYLRFEKVVSVRDEDEGKRKDYRIAVAFGLEPQDQGWKIAPLYPGRVCIYFPAVKETSNLRFHLHAPFASTVARDSVRDYPANNELRNHLAELVAESMHAIREQGLLNVEFLAALPNSRDNLSPFYLPIQERLIQEFNQEKLTPMKRGGHAAALTCYRGRRNLSDLINDEDLAMLLGKDPALPLWIANPPQLNQPEDNFLSMLDISEWEIENLIEKLQSPADSVMEWLNGKSDEWHQELYVLLGDFASASYRWYSLPNLRIVRCSDGAYRIGRECFFPSDDVEYDERFPRVAKGVYSSGRNEDQNQKARDFLEKIKVRQVDEAVEIEAILQQRYAQKPINLGEEVHTRDLNRFIAFVEEDTDKTDLFRDYFIFELGDGGWGKPADVFVDSPWLDTDLSVYHEEAKINGGKLTRNAIDEFAIETRSGNNQNAIAAFKAKMEEISSNYPFRKPLSPKYEAFFCSAPEKLGRFAEAVGAQATLDPRKKPISREHPEYQNLVENMPPPHHAAYSRNEDYIILEFKTLLEEPSIDKSRLIWRTMCVRPDSCLRAHYWTRKHYEGQSYPAKSTLVHDLRSAEWVPQKDGDSINFVKPCDASRALLPEEGFSWPKGHPEDAGAMWLQAIQFGENPVDPRPNEEDLDQRAQEWGFNSGGEAAAAAALTQFLRDQGTTPEEELERRKSRKRRTERLIIELNDAPEREYAPRLRSVRITRDRIDPRTYLRGHYSPDDTMECQMCRRQEMPFKKRNSADDYFLAVEAFSTEHFPKEHEAQYLALCPECAEMYKEFVKRSASARKTLYNLLKTSEDSKVRLESHGHVIRLWFEEKHWLDLQAVLTYYENADDAPEDSTD